MSFYDPRKPHPVIKPEIKQPSQRPTLKQPVITSRIEHPVVRKPLMPFANLRPLQKPTQIYAKHGWHGFVDHPVNFIVGEAGKERVDIYPAKKKKRGTQDFDFGKASSDLGDFDFSGGYV